MSKYSEVNVKLDAYTRPGSDIRPEGLTMERDGKSFYLDFNSCGDARPEQDYAHGSTGYTFEGATVRDKMYGSEISITEEALREAQLKAVHVRCGNEQGLYFEPTEIRTGVDDHYQRGEIAETLEVHGADHGGNDWDVSGHKPRLDEIIADAQQRSAAQATPGKSKEKGKTYEPTEVDRQFD